MRIDLNLNPVVGGKVRVMCKSYRQATKKKAKLERAYPDSCYLLDKIRWDISSCELNE